MSNEDEIIKNYQPHALKLKELHCNNHCADCLAKETEWASTNLGVFICINCSGIHRSLGTHISKIKSLTLDEWEKDAYLAIKNLGNMKANSDWECNLLPFEKPLSHDPMFYRKQFIIDKYVNKMYKASSNNASLKLEREFDIKWVAKKGFLVKQGGKRKTWKRRWMVLHEDTLAYFKTENGSYPQGKILIEPDSLVMFVGEEQCDKKNAFAIITKNRTFYMFAEDSKDLLGWIYSLRASVYFANLKQILNDPRNFLKTDMRSNIKKSGMLKKKGGSIQTTKRRFFVLKDENLAYYKTNKDPEPIGSISLKESKVELVNSRKEFGLKIHTADRQFFLVADSEQSQKEWFEVLVNVAEAYSDAKIIKTKSTAIHNLIIKKLLREAKLDSEKISPHSPMMWKSRSFHRYVMENLDSTTNEILSEDNNRQSVSVNVFSRLNLTTGLYGESIGTESDLLNAEKDETEGNDDEIDDDDEVKPFENLSVDTKDGLLKEERLGTPSEPRTENLNFDDEIPSGAEEDFVEDQSMDEFQRKSSEGSISKKEKKPTPVIDLPVEQIDEIDLNLKKKKKKSKTPEEYQQKMDNLLLNAKSLPNRRISNGDLSPEEEDLDFINVLITNSKQLDKKNVKTEYLSPLDTVDSRNNWDLIQEENEQKRNPESPQLVQQPSIRKKTIKARKKIVKKTTFKKLHKEMEDFLRTLDIELE